MNEQHENSSIKKKDVPVNNEIVQILEDYGCNKEYAIK